MADYYLSPRTLKGLRYLARQDATPDKLRRGVDVKSASVAKMLDVVLGDILSTDGSRVPVVKNTEWVNAERSFYQMMDEDQIRLLENVIWPIYTNGNFNTASSDRKFSSADYTPARFQSVPTASDNIDLELVQRKLDKAYVSGRNGEGFEPDPKPKRRKKKNGQPGVGATTDVPYEGSYRQRKQEQLEAETSDYARPAAIASLLTAGGAMVTEYFSRLASLAAAKVAERDAKLTSLRETHAEEFIGKIKSSFKEMFGAENIELTSIEADLFDVNYCTDLGPDCTETSSHVATLVLGSEEDLRGHLVSEFSDLKQKIAAQFPSADAGVLNVTGFDETKDVNLGTLQFDVPNWGLNDMPEMNAIHVDGIFGKTRDLYFEYMEHSNMLNSAVPAADIAAIGTVILGTSALYLGYKALENFRQLENPNLRRILFGKRKKEHN